MYQVDPVRARSEAPAAPTLRMLPSAQATSPAKSTYAPSSSSAGMSCSSSSRRPSSLPPRKLFQMRFDADHHTQPNPQVPQKPATADPVTRLVFKNIHSAMGECLELCKGLSYFNQIHPDDQQLLYEKSLYELVIVRKIRM